MVAAMLGTPLMEWQQHVADVLLEIDPDTGELVYTDWTLTVPRQSGKSTLILAKASHRCSATSFFGSNQNLAYTAQTAKKAGEKFEKEYQAAIKRAKRLRARLRTGNMKIDIRYANGSAFAVESTTEKAGHGSVLDEGYIDEAFSQVDNRTEQAFEPAMITRRNRQLGVVSTAGWLDASPYLWAKVQGGRAMVESGVRRGTAYFEWSAPEDADPSDESVWLECMPAVHRPDCGADCKRHTIQLSAIRSVYQKAVRENKVADFRRAYLNQWRPKPKQAEETAVGNWLACATELAGFKPAAVGLAISLERDFGSLGVFGYVTDGDRAGAEFLGAQDRIPLTGRDGQTVDHLVAEAARIGQQYDIPVGVVDSGQTKGHGPKITAAGEERIERGEATQPVRVFAANFPQYVVACSEIVDQVRDRKVVHMNHPELNEAVMGARWKPGENRVFARKTSETDVAMLEAVTVARKACVALAEEAQEPWAVFM